MGVTWSPPLGVHSSLERVPASALVTGPSFPGQGFFEPIPTLAKQYWYQCLSVEYERRVKHRIRALLLKSAFRPICLQCGAVFRRASQAVAAVQNRG